VRVSSNGHNPWPKVILMLRKPMASTQEGHTQVVRFSPDGGRLATGGSDGRVRIWSYPAMDLLQELVGLTSMVCESRWGQTAFSRVMNF
jgi:WD40 repeat protein